MASRYDTVWRTELKPIIADAIVGSCKTWGDLGI